jgi:hypothetical protein
MLIFKLHLFRDDGLNIYHVCVFGKLEIFLENLLNIFLNALASPFRNKRSGMYT